MLCKSQVWRRDGDKSFGLFRVEENWTNVWLGVEDAPEVELIVGVSDANRLLQVATFESGYIWDDNGEEDDDHLNWVGGHISSIIVLFHAKL